MFCKNCGKENADSAEFCAGCGSLLKPEVTPDNISVETATSEAVAEVNDPGKVFGLLGLIFGIVGLAVSCLCCFCGIISLIMQCGFSCVSIAGIILSAIGKKKSKAAGINNKFANIGLILSIIALAVFLIFIIYYILSILLGFGMMALDI